MKRIITLIVAACAAFVAHAADDFVNIKLLTGLQATSPEIVSANLTNLSPQAIELGLRDAELLADFSYDEKTRVLDIEWHSISKEVKGTKLSETFSIPLNSKVKLGSDTAGINAGQKMVAVGDGTEIIDAYNRLLAQAQENIDIDNSKKMLNAEDNNNSSGSSGGSSGGSGYLSDSGVGGDSTENAAFEDVEVTTDPVISNVQECPMRVDLAGMVVYEQERTIKTSTETGDVVEATPCEQAGEQYPIRKDFEAGCSVKTNENSGEYIKGYKLYSFINGERYDISECEWSQDDAIAYKVLKDFDACPVDQGVIKEADKSWHPAYVQFTEIEGNRYDLSTCTTDPNTKRALLVSLERCEPSMQIGEMIAYARKREVLYHPDGKNKYKAYDCQNTGETYALKRHLDYQGCSTLPDYNNAKLFRGLRYYVTENGLDVYLSECTTSSEVFHELDFEIEKCEANVNFTANTATITKQFSFMKENGEKEFVTDCVDTNEVYEITDTEESCLPQVVPGANKVVLFKRKAWMDAEDNLHFVGDCRATSGEVAITKEYCENPRYEHDAVGGNSYFRSRDFYVYNDDKFYVNACTRDTSEAFKHVSTTSGCGVSHDNGNKRSRRFARVYVNTSKDSGIAISGCAATGGYIAYTLHSTNPQAQSGRKCSKSSPSTSILKQTLLSMFPGATITGSTYRNTGNCGTDNHNKNYYSWAWSKTQNQWRRFDGSYYTEAPRIVLR